MKSKMEREKDLLINDNYRRRTVRNNSFVSFFFLFRNCMQTVESRMVLLITLSQS